jgi:hypothetical protein
MEGRRGAEFPLALATKAFAPCSPRAAASIYAPTRKFHIFYIQSPRNQQVAAAHLSATEQPLWRKTMNLLSGNFSLQLDLTLESLLSRAVAAAESEENNPSPYCSAEEGGSGVKGLPVRKSSTKVALNGQVIQVMEARICCDHGDGPITATVIEMETL